MASTVTIRTTETARDLLAGFARNDGRPIAQVVEELARREADRRQLHEFVDDLSAMNPEQLRAYRDEQRAWDEAGLDGLGDSP